MTWVEHPGHENGVSDVVGTMVMVLIAILLTLTVGMHIISTPEKPDPYATVSFDEDTESDTVRLELTGMAAADYVRVEYQGSTVAILDEIGDEASVDYSRTDGEDVIYAYGYRDGKVKLLTKYTHHGRWWTPGALNAPDVD